MLLFRFGPEGFYAVGDEARDVRLLHSDPLTTPPAAWELGRRLSLAHEALRVPIEPGKIVGVGRNYRDHAAELGNPMPAEPLLFLKGINSLSGPKVPILLPPESQRVEYEGEVAVVVGARLRRAGAAECERAMLGVTCANDVTARDLQKRDATFARGKSFDSFCPLGPAIAVGAPRENLTVTTRLNGVECQRGETRDMAWGLVELLVYISRHMTLEPGDVVLTGTPAGVGPLADGDRVEVEVSGVGVLENPVEAWRQ